MPVISLILPLPVSTNRLHVGSGKSKRRTEDYAAWREEAGWEINRLRPRLAVRALPAGCLFRPASARCGSGLCLEYEDAFPFALSVGVAARPASRPVAGEVDLSGSDVAGVVRP